MSRRNRYVVITLIVVLSTLLASCAAPTPTPAPTAVPKAQATAVPPTAVPPTVAPTKAPPTAVPPTATPAPPKIAGNLRIAVKQDATVLNPYLGFSETETFVIGLIYDTLLYWDPEKDLQPGLADSWAFGDGGMSISFKLNPNAKWHDGTPVTVQDVIYSADLVKAKFPQIGRSVANVTKVEAVGEREVKFSLNQPWPDAPRYIGNTISIVPKAVWEKITDPANFTNLEKPIGSGAFAFKERAAGQRIVLENTGKHHRIKPNIQTITLEVVGDESVAVMALKKGDFDALSWDVSPSLALDVRDKPANYPNIKLATAAGTSTKTLMFNLRKAPFNDVKFRQAVAKAIDTKSIIDKALMGLADPLGPGLVASSAGWYNSKVAMVAFDAEKAKAELEAAGYKDANKDGLHELPDGKPLKVTILVPVGQPSTDVGDIMAANLTKVGIQAEVKPLAPDAFLNQLRLGDFDAALSGPSMSIQPGMMFFYFHSSRGVITSGRVAGFNYGGYNSPEYDKLADASSKEVDWAKRKDILFQMQELLAKDMPQVPLYVPKVLNLYRDDKLTGWVVKPSSGILNSETFEKLQAK